MSVEIELSAEDVVSYLQQHPDFFKNHPELLETLFIPHPVRGNAVSLIERQLEIFRNRHGILEGRLMDLIEIAKDNDVISGRIHELTLALLNASTLEKLFENLEQVLTECFLTDFLTLKIITDDKKIANGDFFLASDDPNLAVFREDFAGKLPRCARLRQSELQFLFQDAASEVKSCAIIPVLYPGLTALLVIGSKDEDRFCPDMGNLFLIQIGEIVGTRLLTLLGGHSFKDRA